MKYSPGFKASIVRKTQDGSGRSVNQMARETGVSYTTIANWIEQYRIGKLIWLMQTGYPHISGIPEKSWRFYLKAKPCLMNRKVNGLGNMGCTPNIFPSGNRS